MARPPMPEPPAASDHPVTILVVDDVADTCRMYGDYFRYVGAAVLSAKDGAEALDLIERHHPDAVLLDLAMPRMTGQEVLTAIRAQPQTAHLPVIAITGQDAQGVRDATLKAGADLFLTKPCLPHVALNFILQLLRTHGPH